MLLFCLALLHAEPSLVFVGNSYTQTNNLHYKVSGMLGQHAAGWTGTQSVALVAGGLTYADHANLLADETSTWYTAFHEQHDIFILQDQSQIPGFPQGNGYWQASLNGLLEMQEVISQQDAQTILMITWGRKDGDVQNPDMYPDFQTMQTNLNEGYLAFAETASTETKQVYTAPVGPVFSELLELDQALFESLYSSDGSHPSQIGSSTAALCLFSSITGRQVDQIPTDLEPAIQETISRAIDTVILQQDVGSYPLPWFWTTIPANGIISNEKMRPLVYLTDDKTENITIDDGRLWVVDGHLQGTVTLSSDSEFTIKGGQYTGEVDGDISVTDGTFILSEVTGSLQQSGGLVQISSLITSIGTNAVLGTIDLHDSLQEGHIQAQTIDITEASLAESDLYWELTDDTNGQTLVVYRQDSGSEPSQDNFAGDNQDDDDKDTGCAGTGFLLIFIPYLFRRKY
jgi:hypothetical protein